MNFTRTMLCCISLLLFVNGSLYGQQDPEEKKVFLRVFDLNGKKVAKGKFHSATDSVLILNNRKELVEVPYAEIGFIRTRKSVGNNFLIGAVIGSALMTIGFATTSGGPGSGFIDWDLASSFALGPILGAPFGALFGGMTAPFKKIENYTINGDWKNWIRFKVDFMNSGHTPETTPVTILSPLSPEH